MEQESKEMTPVIPLQQDRHGVTVDLDPCPNMPFPGLGCGCENVGGVSVEARGEGEGGGEEDGEEDGEGGCGLECDRHCELGIGEEGEDESGEEDEGEGEDGGGGEGEGEE